MRRLVLGLAFVVAGCHFPAAPSGLTHADGFAAVDQAFARFGPAVVACAHGVAARESNHWPYARNGQYAGIFQMHPGFQGSINVAAATLGRSASFYDPYVNAWAAAIGFDSAVGAPTDNVGSFRNNWGQTVPAGCP